MRRSLNSAAFLFIFGLSYLIAIGPVEGGGWSRDIIPLGTQPADQYVFKPFELVLVSGQDEHVYGLCVLVNEKPALTWIDGTETPDGEFYPYVAFAVANDDYGEWQPIGPTSNPGKTSTLAVEAKRPSKTLMVDLDGFLPMLQKFRYGKIALRTGESVVFKLEKLLPPA